MEATLKFNLPEEQPEFDNAVNGWRWSVVAWQLDQHLRSQLKHNDKLTEEQYDTLQEVRDKLWEIVNEHSLSFD